MKRYLLFWLFCLTTHCCLAQTQDIVRHEFSWTISVVAQDATSGCDSYVSVVAEMMNGTERLITRVSLDNIYTGGFGNRVVNGTFVYNGDNKIKRLRVYSIKKNGGCGVIGSATTYMDVNNDYYFCPSDRRTGIFPGFNSLSSFTYHIFPICERPELRIEVNNKLSRAAYDLQSWAIIHYADGSNSATSYAISLQDKSYMLPSTTEWTEQSMVFWTFNNIREIEIVNRYKTSATAGYTQTSKRFAINNNGALFTTTGTLPYGTLSAADATIKFTYQQTQFHLWSGPDPNNTILPVDTKISLQAPDDILPGTCRWHYSTDGVNFQSIPWYTTDPHFKNPNFLSGRDVFWNDVLNYVDKDVWFRTQSTCHPSSGSGLYSLPFKMTVRLSVPDILTATPQHVTCFGKSDGRIKIMFSRQLYANETLELQVVDPNTGPGGTLKNFPVVMAADNSFTTPADQPLPAGTYNLTLIGGYKGNATYSGAETHKATVTIKNPDPLVFSSPATSPVKCFNGTDGSISLTATGGTPDYSLLYKPVGSTSFSAVPFNAGAGLVDGLTPGDYVVSLTDINACPAKNASGAAEVTVTVTQPDAPVERDNVTATNPLAFGSADGNIIVRLKGGTPFSDGSYNVTWTKAGQPITPVNTIGSGIYTTRINNLSDGTYTLTVKDKNYDAAAAPGKEGCFYTFDVTLTEPPLLVAGIVVADSISCNGNSDGSLQVQASGGVPFAAAPYYTFRWYQEVNGVWEDLGLTGIKATGLEAGRYRVRVTDANGIERYSSPKDFIQPDELAISLIETPATCYGGSNGHVAATVAGGTSPFTYSWSNGGQQAVISNLSSGSYTLNVTDYHGCQVSTLAYVAQPAEALKIVSAPTTLPRGYGYTDGSIRVLLNGATPKADGSYNITWKSEDGTVLSSHTETKLATGYETLLSNIGAGEYILTVTDANYTGTGLPSDQQACYLEQSFTVTQPDPIVTVVSEQHYVSCKGDADGVLEVDVTGGIPFTGTGQLPYNYQWYIINNGTPVLLPHTTARAGGLKAGSYKVIVTDMNTVSNESAVYILVEPDLLEVTFDIRAVSCNSGTDGFVKTTTIGGTLPYTYSWTNGATTPDIIDVATGTYGLFLTDDHACIVQKDNVVNEPAAPLAVKDVVPTNPKAFGYTDGQIAVTLTGGTPDAAGLYNIAWFDAAGNPLTDFTQTNTANGVVTILKNRGDGDYTLKVKDAQFDNSTDGSTTGCYVAATYTLTEPLLLEAAIREYRYISCIGLSDGQLAAHAQGGIAFTTGLPYHYQWFRILNGAEVLIPQTDSIITGMPAGAYLVKVTDANNITRSSQQFTLTAPAKLEIGFTTTAVTCASGMDGEVASTVTGGTFPYHYNWTTGETTADISQLTEGTYLLFVEDAHGCVARNQVDIYIPDGIKTDPVVKAPTCHDDCNGTIQLNMSGGIAPYQYAWDNNSSEKNQSDLCAGKYTVTITDANGCKRIQAFTLENPSPLTVNIGADKTICNGQTWTVNAAIADAAASYKWSGDNNFNAVKSAVTFSQEGTYDVLVTDSKGCKGTDTIIIKQYTADIAAEFVAPTQAFSKATVSFINISYPAPEWVDWVIPAHPGISLVSKTNQMMELQFAEEGVYNITMRAHVGDCEQVFTKDITVLKGEDFATPGGAKTPFILNYTVQPNPNEGQFTVHVSLDKQADIRIRMINIISNMLVSDRKESAGQEFNLNYQLNVPAGTYLLLLETPLGNAVRKVVINK